jgi:hypothetical protein
MSIDTASDYRRWLDWPEEGRFQRRAEPPEPLFGPPNVNYPARDGRPMADNTIQLDWIFKIKGGLDVVFRDHPDVFVAGNLMWYPVRGNNRRRLAPDAMVVFGRPKGDRSSYIQHEEDDIPPQVVFEVLSPGNRKRAMDYKRRVYEKYGVEEYYVFDPYKIRLEVWLKEGDAFRLIPEADGWVSPRLGIRFELDEDLTIYAPDGRPFLDYAGVTRQRDESERRSERAEKRAGQAERRLGRSERKIEAERQRTEAERQRADAERQRAERLAAKLRELGLEPEE